MYFDGPVTVSWVNLKSSNLSLYSLRLLMAIASRDIQNSLPLATKNNTDSSSHMQVTVAGKAEI